MIPLPSASKRADAAMSNRPDRDRTNPTSTALRRLPSTAKRADSRLPTPKPRLKSRFRRVRPRVSGWTPPTPRRGGAAGGGISVEVDFSGTAVERRIPGSTVGHHNLERWAVIEAGGVPEDDDVKPPPTSDQVDEDEQEATAEIEAWGRQREEQIRDDAEEARAAAHREADSLEDDAATADPRARSTLMRRAHAVREHGDEEYHGAQREMDAVAEEVREQRAQVRAELQRQVEAMNEKYEDRARELSRGLHSEIEKTINETYFRHGGDASLTSWELE